MSAESNRQAMPAVAVIYDEFKQVFGPRVRVVYAEENEKVLGKKPKHWQESWDD
ncbi:MAG TPA: hypothetical protein V6C97_27030 [Oculatellaceae cyanobacterium]